MKRSLPTPTAKPRAVLLPAVLLAVVAAFILLPGGAAKAQTPASAVTEAPVVTARAAGAHAVELSWTAVSGAVRYELWTWTDAGGWRRLDDGSLTGRTYAHGGLSAVASHWYAVRGVDASGRAGPWSEYTAATGSGTQNPAPTGTATHTSTATPAQTAAPTSTSTPAAGTPTPTDTPTDTPTATAGAVPSAPGLTVAATANGILLSWNAVPHAVRYELWTWWDAGVGWQALGGGNLTGTTYTHADVTAGTTYYYSIRALNAAGDASAWLEPYPSATALAVTGAGTSTPTATATATSTSTPPAASGTSTPTATPTSTSTPTPTAPAGVVPSTPALTAAATTGGILLTWQAVAHAVRYELWTWWDAGIGWQPVGGANLTGTTWTHTTVTAGTTYYYSIRALNASGDASAWLEPYPSATALAVTGAGTPTPTATATPTVTPTPEVTPTAAVTERGALIALYQATGGPNWTQNNNWLTDAPLGSWDRVRTNASGRVIGLHLGRNNMTGPLPDLSALTELQVLALPQNRLTGPVPALAALSNLRVLDLGNNRLSGPLPDLSALASLRELNLGSNELSGSIPDLSALANLEALDGRNNKLSGSIPDLSALANLRELNLGSNELSGSIPDLSALANLETLDLIFNELSGEIPDLSALANLETLDGRNNKLSGSIPDLNALASLRKLDLGSNELSGEIPDLSTLASLQNLSLNNNRLSGNIPDLAALASLSILNLSDNELSGPVLDLPTLTSLRVLDLRNNGLNGPVPNLNALANLRSLDLSGNRFCLPAGASLSHANMYLAAHLKSLNPPTCTAAELAAFPAAPRNLTATVGAGRVTLTWDVVTNADGYDLWVWNSLDRRWGQTGGFLTAATYTHAVLTDGRNYYYQVRARNAAGVRGPWSPQLYVAVVEPQYPPPPPSLGLALFYQKYLEISGVVVVAPSEVSDGKLAQVREVVAAMFSDRSAFFQELAANYIRIVIFKVNAAGEGIIQLPERRTSLGDDRGGTFPTSTGWAAVAAEEDEHCYVLIHEFAHAIQFALEDQPDGREFSARVQDLYNAALDAGLWRSAYASTNTREYWAEAVTFWFHEFVRAPPEARGKKLEDYDPEMADLIAETFGEDAYVPAYCKP